jgi:hypothetical protein
VKIKVIVFGIGYGILKGLKGLFSLPEIPQDPPFSIQILFVTNLTETRRSENTETNG